MSTEENKVVARRAYDALNQALQTGNWSAVEEVLAADIVDHNPTPGQGPGLEGAKQAFSGFSAAFPDLTFMVEDMIAEGDKVASRITARGTHKGDFQGLPATDKQVTQAGIDILRIASGKVVERWGQFDDLGLLQQLGVVPPPPG